MPTENGFPWSAAPHQQACQERQAEVREARTYRLPPDGAFGNQAGCEPYDGYRRPGPTDYSVRINHAPQLSQTRRMLQEFTSELPSNESQDTTTSFAAD